MATRRSIASGNDSSKYDHEKGTLQEHERVPGAVQQNNIVDPDEYLADVKHDLHRGLKARHITMIAIGGAIGTGLIIGT